MDVVAYHRVSTKRQGEPGLGLAAQREYVRIAAQAHGWDVTEHYEEVGVSDSIHPIQHRKVLRLSRMAAQ